MHGAVGTAGTVAQGAAGEDGVAVAVVGGGGGVIEVRGWHAEQVAACGEVGLPPAMGEQAVITDAMEARREDVHEHTADELGGGEAHRLLPCAPLGPVVGVAESHLARLDVEDPLVRDGDAVGIPADIVEHLGGAGEGRLGVDDPVRLPGRAEMVRPRGALGEARQLAGELEPAGVKRLLEGREEEPPKEARQHPDRQEEARAAGHPAGPVGRQAAAWHDAMQMG